MSACKCDLRTRLVGDGCEACNPELAVELLKETVDDQHAEIARLRLTDAERAAVDRASETLRYLQADYGKTQTEQDAGTLRGLLERTK